MSRLRMDKCACLTAGLGLVVLLAAQEKAGPWKRPVEVPAEAGPPSAVGDGPAAAPGDPAAPPFDAPTDGDAPSQDDRPKKVRLGFVVPDTAAPRWTGSWHAAELRLGAGSRDGVVACGQRDSSSAGQVLACGSSRDWHALQLDPSPTQLTVAATLPPTNPRRLLTDIPRTGPPARV